MASGGVMSDRYSPCARCGWPIAALDLPGSRTLLEQPYTGDDGQERQIVHARERCRLIAELRTDASEENEP